jgi:hypothetical protein
VEPRGGIEGSGLGDRAPIRIIPKYKAVFISAGDAQGKHKSGTRYRKSELHIDAGGHRQESQEHIVEPDPVEGEFHAFRGGRKNRDKKENHDEP